MYPRIAIIGGGPAGLAAADVLVGQDFSLELFEAKPSLGRKFLMAGKSGLNLTHAEPLEPFLTRFGAARPGLEPALRAFEPQAIRDWADGLGVETFIGSSRRVFPKEMKAAPLLRAWIRGLKERGLIVHVRHRWTGWDDQGRLRFDTPDGQKAVAFDAVLLALGGASWPELGSDAAWIPWLEARGVPVSPFRPANCGFNCAWSAVMQARFAGAPVQSVRLSHQGRSVLGDFVVTESGIEGSAVYALSSGLRDALERDGRAELVLDLAPNRTEERLAHDLAEGRGGRSLTAFLERSAGLSAVKIALLREVLGVALPSEPLVLASAIKALALPLLSPRPIAEAISSAGGIPFAALDPGFMLRQVPGVFACGEMLDWEAPTGGYLLTACLATGRHAGEGVFEYLVANSDQK